MAERDIRELFSNSRSRKRQRQASDNNDNETEPEPSSCASRPVETLPSVTSHDIGLIIDDDDVPSEALVLHNSEQVCLYFCRAALNAVLRRPGQCIA